MQTEHIQNWVTEIVIIGITQDNTRLKIECKIGAPKKIENNDWGCPVSLAPLYENLGDIRGSDSLHSLCLAIRFIHSLLRKFEEDGGKLQDETSEQFTLDSYFPHLYPD